MLRTVRILVMEPPSRSAPRRHQGSRCRRGGFPRIRGRRWHSHRHLGAASIRAHPQPTAHRGRPFRKTGQARAGWVGATRPAVTNPHLNGIRGGAYRHLHRRTGRVLGSVRERLGADEPQGAGPCRVEQVDSRPGGLGPQRRAGCRRPEPEGRLRVPGAVGSRPRRTDPSAVRAASLRVASTGSSRTSEVSPSSLSSRARGPRSISVASRARSSAAAVSSRPREASSAAARSRRSARSRAPCTAAASKRSRARRCCRSRSPGSDSRARRAPSAARQGRWSGDGSTRRPPASSQVPSPLGRAIDHRLAVEGAAQRRAQSLGRVQLETVRSPAPRP